MQPKKTVLVLFTIIFFTVLSCKKDNNTATSPLTKQQILVQKPWQVNEVWRNDQGTLTHYLKGSVNNTGTNYDNMHITFKADGTGTYTDDGGVIHTTTWQFTTPDLRNMSITITSPGSTTLIWSLVEITDGSLVTSTPLNNNFLISARYTQ